MSDEIKRFAIWITHTFLAHNAASNCRSKVDCIFRFFEKYKTAYGGQIGWLCYI